MHKLDTVTNIVTLGVHKTFQSLLDQEIAPFIDTVRNADHKLLADEYDTAQQRRGSCKRCFRSLYEKLP